jgi:hypothetical protein
MPKSFEEPFRSGNFDWITTFAIKKRPIDITTEIIGKIIFSSTISFNYFSLYLVLKLDKIHVQEFFCTQLTPRNPHSNYCI